MELLISEDVLKSIKENTLLRKSLLENDKVDVICVKHNLKLFLTHGDDFMSLTLFFEDGHYDDSQILIGKSEKSRNWALELFDFYFNLGVYYNGK